MKKQEKEFIRASGTQGFKKSAVRVTVESPNEKIKQVLFGEISNVRPDLRKRRKHNYVTLFTLGKHGRNKFTYDILKGSLSLTTALGFHYDFTVLDELDLSKLLAVLCIKGVIDISKREISKKLEMFTQHFIQDFTSKIRHARHAYKMRHRKV